MNDNVWATKASGGVATLEESVRHNNGRHDDVASLLALDTVGPSGLPLESGASRAPRSAERVEPTFFPALEAALVSRLTFFLLVLADDKRIGKRDIYA